MHLCSLISLQRASGLVTLISCRLREAQEHLARFALLDCPSGYGNAAKKNSLSHQRAPARCYRADARHSPTRADGSPHVPRAGASAAGEFVAGYYCKRRGQSHRAVLSTQNWSMQTIHPTDSLTLLSAQSSGRKSRICAHR